MPGWHEATLDLQQAGKVQLVGIIQEQHADRARLFMQWKQMGWPVLVDSLNLLGVSVVPITVLIDEYGIIRALRPSQADFQEFLKNDYRKPSFTSMGQPNLPDLERLEKKARQADPEALRSYGDALFLWGKPSKISKVIEVYERAVGKEPNSGPTQFRLGVAYRRRYDSDARQRDDFRRAAEHWSKALDIDPNQYIWRRRIQQYGPRLDKPYSFYDWVDTARREIAARGEKPAPLSVEPGGAEFANPAKSFETTQPSREKPDPEGRIRRDTEGLIRVETTVVPVAMESGKSARVHVVFRPNLDIKAHWNNEVGNLMVWIDPPEGWQVDSRYLTVPNPTEAVSKETRKVEFEVKSPTDFTGAQGIPAYALYYVCEGVKGTCLYRRQNLVVQVQVVKR